MESGYNEGKSFSGEDFRQKPPVRGEYENCVFTDCDFSNLDLEGFRFIDCSFHRCNLSLARIVNVSFQDARFTDCKMLGLHFDKCNSFGLSLTFRNCTLDHSSFYGTKLKKTVFDACQIHEADFTGCDLTGALFGNCDLHRSTFEHTTLEGCDFRTALNYTIDPELNRVKKARFSTGGIAGLLAKYDIVIEPGP
jgi:uncharacterized protein YjbI with pentapeptide repeats